MLCPKIATVRHARPPKRSVRIENAKRLKAETPAIDAEHARGFDHRHARDVRHRDAVREDHRVTGASEMMDAHQVPHRTLAQDLPQLRSARRRRGSAPGCRAILVTERGEPLVGGPAAYQQ